MAPNVICHLQLPEVSTDLSKSLICQVLAKNQTLRHANICERRLWRTRWIPVRWNKENIYFTRWLFRAWPHPWLFNNLIFAELAEINWQLYFLNSLFIERHKMSQELQLFSSLSGCHTSVPLSDSFPCPATKPFKTWLPSFASEFHMPGCWHTVYLVRISFLRQHCGSLASDWSESCWPEPARWWTHVLFVGWTEQQSPTLLE